MELKKYIGCSKAARKLIRADLVIKNANISHNIIVIGDNDEDIILAVKELERTHGGYTIVENGEVYDTLELPVMGLISDRDLNMSVSNDEQGRREVPLPAARTDTAIIPQWRWSSFPEALSDPF